MTDDIRILTQRLADEPGSLAFLELAEALRRRGQLEAAAKVARGGVNRYPGLADAHDLLGRILSDLGDLAGAFDAWADALRLDPMRVGALKGVAFLYFKAGDVEAALAHLERASEADPDDPSVLQAMARVRRDGRAAQRPESDPPATATAPRDGSGPAGEPFHPATPADATSGPPDAAAPAPPPPAHADSRSADSPFAGLDEDERGLLLVDGSGQRLGGRLGAGPVDETGDRVAAHLAGLTREAARATRLLGLGGWHSIAIESPDAHLFLTAPTTDTVLLAMREPSLPMARVGL
ncbi:MAG TPA: tetratricopeptide repeat protein, partial [Gemmatimonadales bacterium]|nr:tetratricopeptide repeat protein [Gemmatimonadales bacterium]